MDKEVLPHAWTWPDDEGCDHMVVAGAQLELGEGRKPAFHALCGRSVPVRDLMLRQKFWQCDECFAQLGKWIEARLDA